MTTMKAWAIGDMDHGIDGRSGKPEFVAKMIYDTEHEARDHVFDPFMVKEIEIDVTRELDRLKKLLGPKGVYVLNQYHGDAIKSHLLGKDRIGEAVSDLDE